MSIEEKTVEERVREIVAKETGHDPSKITPDVEFVTGLGMDSLAQVELIMSLEEEFGCEISDEEAQKIIRFSDAVKFVENHISQQG